MSQKVAIIGGGPAGMMAAIRAGADGHRVCLFEQNTELGKKLLITGGGRCNLTSSVTQAIFLERLIGQARFLRPALSALSQTDLIDFFEQRGVPLKAEGDKIYPKSDQARDILDCLSGDMKRLGVAIRLGTPVKNVIVEERAVTVITERPMAFDKVIIATGGVSYPVTGSDGRLLATLEPLDRIPWRPGLSSLYSPSVGREIMGISLADAVLMYQKSSVRGELLFTHYGLSGPAALDLSNHLSGRAFPLEITLDLLPDRPREALAEKLFGSNKDLDRRLRGLLPKRLLSYLLRDYRDRDTGNLKRSERSAFLDQFKAWPVTILRLGAIEQATISLGGVALSQLRPRTLEHRTMRGVYFAGECLDLAGPTGGYNLQIAFSTGYLAGRLG